MDHLECSSAQKTTSHISISAQLHSQSLFQDARIHWRTRNEDF